MKKTLTPILALCLLLSLAACGGAASSFQAAPAPASTSQPASVPEPAKSEAASLPPEPAADSAVLEPLFSTYMGDKPGIPDFLDAQQQDLYFAAFIVTAEMNGFGTGFGSDFDQAETIDMDNGATYWRCNGAFSTWDEFQAATDAIFTRAFFDEMNGTNTEYPVFIDHEGGLYLTAGGRGGNMEYDGNEVDTFELVSQDDSTISFILVGHYKEWESEETYTDTFPIEMQNTDAGWRFSQFSIAF